MTKRTLAYCVAVFMSATLYMGCNDSVTGKDCMVNCQDVDNTCVKQCNDDQCRMKCTTDLDNCNLSCGSVTVSGTGGSNASGGTTGAGGSNASGGTTGTAGTTGTGGRY